MELKKDVPIFVLIILFSISFVFAANIVLTSSGENSFSVNEDSSNLFNISINNTYIGITKNISWVNVTIPLNFTFTAGTNSSDSGIHTFSNISNTSTVLTWNGSGLVMNGSLNYFSFNATSNNPGVYNFTITTLNATGAINTTNISVTVNSVVPTVTLISPDNVTSATTSAYNFTFNVTDTGTISFCELFINEVYYNNLTTITTGTTLGLYNNSFSEATHTWIIGCTDSDGNSVNSSSRIFIVNTIPAVTSNSDGSGSTSLFKPSASQLESGYKRDDLYKNYQIKIPFGLETHKLTILDITSTTLKIKIESDAQEATLIVGEEKKFDLDSDGTFDLSVKLNKITEDFGRFPSVEITTKTIPRIVDSGSVEEQEESGNMAEVVSVVRMVAQGERGNFVFWFIGGIIILVVIMGIIFNVRKKRKN